MIMLVLKYVDNWIEFFVEDVGSWILWNCNIYLVLLILLVVYNYSLIVNNFKRVKYNVKNEFEKN